MAETKRKKSLNPAKSSKRRKGGREKWRKGPLLPNSLRKELDSLNPNNSDDEEIRSQDNDVYEYEEELPEEESKKNRRYDPVDNFEYKLPKEFEDEDVASDDDNEEEDVDGMGERDMGSKDEDHDEDEDDEDEGKHKRMLQQITGLPGDAFDGKKKKNDKVIFEAYPESEYNPSRDILDGDGRISINDLLGPLHGKSRFSKIREDIQRIHKKSMSIQPPLPKPQQEKIARQAAFQYSKKEMTKWEPLVKKNREAPTIFFDENVDVGYSTVGAIASEFKPRTEFEKKMDLLVNAKEISEAHRGDGAKLLELNQTSVEDVKERQDRLAKMRDLLFRHELKAKRIKKIKSKTYRRLLKKDRSKAIAIEIEMDPEAAKELAEKEEFRRAEERLTLKHKNTSKWAKRVIKRGYDDGTRAALSEQLQQHALLTRKRNSMHDDSSSDDSIEDEDDDHISGEEDGASKLKLLENGRRKTLEVLQDEDEMPKSGVLVLPFMVRGLKKKKEEADEEARLALQEFESSLKQLEDNDELRSSNVSSFSGRKVFGAPKKQLPQPDVKVDTDNYYGGSDSEDDSEARENITDEHGSVHYPEQATKVDPNILRQESEIAHDTLFKSFDDLAKDPGRRTTFEVSLFASNSSKKKKSLPEDIKQVKKEEEANIKNSSKDIDLASSVKDTDIEDGDRDNDTDDAGYMVDGILSSGNGYELPSQDDLIRRAFAGDNVEKDFEMDKRDILNDENPEPEKPVLLPGWGQWTHIQKKRGLPSWMVAEHDKARRKREEDLKKRSDAHLKHVIISEKCDKKAEKFQTKMLPYPHTSAEHFELSMRVPIGPDFNPATTITQLNRPEVVKKPGAIIKPIQYKNVNPHERSEEHKQGRPKQRNKSKGKSDRRTKH